MWESLLVPGLKVKFLRWINDDEFIGLHVSGKEVICHVRYWFEVKQ